MNLCPRCQENFYTPYGEPPTSVPYPALSRSDNATLICSRCGETETLQNWIDPNRPLATPDQWPVDTSGLPDGSHRSLAE